MRVKEGVSAVEIHPSVRFALIVVDYTWEEVFGEEPTLTCLQEGEHSDRSLHYGLRKYGTRGDIRCRGADLRYPKNGDLTRESIFMNKFRSRIGSDFDMLFHGNPRHFHMEWDPQWMR